MVGYGYSSIMYMETKKGVILLDLRSAYNVGSIFRTADGAGVKKIYLVGHTPTPKDRFGRVQPEIKKTALGATDSVAWEHHHQIDSVLTELKQQGFCLIAVEQHPLAVAYDRYTPIEPTAFIFGNEVDGMPDWVCRLADVVLEIPLRGQKESLNVAVAAGIVLFNSFTNT